MGIIGCLLRVSLLGTIFRQRLYLDVVCYPSWACDSDWCVNGSYVIPVLAQAIGVLVPLLCGLMTFAGLVSVLEHFSRQMVGRVDIFVIL